jgi:hypothetical protein
VAAVVRIAKLSMIVKLLAAASALLACLQRSATGTRRIRLATTHGIRILIHTYMVIHRQGHMAAPRDGLGYPASLAQARQ